MTIAYPRFTLTSDDIKSLETLAKDRCKPKRGADIHNKKVDLKRTDFSVDYLGVQAEHCFSLLFDVDIHHIPGVLHGDGGKYDYELEGINFSIKGSFSNAQYLLVPKYQYPIPEEVNVLVTFKQISRRMMTCPGYTTREHFMEHHEWKDLGYGEDAVMHHTKLRPIQELVDMIKESRGS